MIKNWYYNMFFKIKIYELNAQAFEDFFTQIMKSYKDNFQKVKAVGKTGDRSCDGFIKNTGEYFAVYAPENIAKNKYNKRNKILNDVKGILANWPDCKKIYYVINDKFNGLPPEILDLFDEYNKNLEATKVKVDIFSMEKLQEIFLALNEEKLHNILGFKPDLSHAKPVVDFYIISEIIKYIDNISQSNHLDTNLIPPDFNKKLIHNKFSQFVIDQFNWHKYSIHKVYEFFDKNYQYNMEELKNKLVKIYHDACSQIPNKSDSFSDERLFYMLQKICYNLNSQSIINHTFVILTLFFESCDIFEKPKE